MLLLHWTHYAGPGLQPSPYFSVSIRTKRSLVDHSGILISSKLKSLVFTVPCRKKIENSGFCHEVGVFFMLELEDVASVCLKYFLDIDFCVF